MKGQFFILGAIILSLLFFLGIPKQGEIQKDSGLEDFAGNMKAEFPKSFNQGLADGTSVERGINFTAFSREAAERRNINLQTLWVVIIPSASGINITAANFLTQSSSISIRITGGPFDQNATLHPDPEESSSTDFFPPDTFNITITWDGRESTREISRGRMHLYQHLRVEKGGDAIIKEYWA